MLEDSADTREYGRVADDKTHPRPVPPKLPPASICDVLY